MFAHAAGQSANTILALRFQLKVLELNGYKNFKRLNSNIRRCERGRRRNDRLLEVARLLGQERRLYGGI
jgi:hypothetical protein